MALAKITRLALLVICLLAILSLTIVSCGGVEPTYTESKVIAIIKSYAPTCAQSTQDAVFTAEFQGGKWKVLKECVKEGEVVSSETWYFDEQLGKAQRGF
ncbi:hypothetical protein ACFLX7_01290 [Chloroflexota bacterium]